MKPEKATPPRTDTAVTKAPTKSETTSRCSALSFVDHSFLLYDTAASKPAPSIQQKQQQQQHHSIPACDDDFEPSDVATTVVEATLAEVCTRAEHWKVLFSLSSKFIFQDHDYSPPMSSHSTPHPMSMESKPTTVPIIPQPQRLHSAPAPTTIIDDKQWFYRDPQNTVQGPFSAADMERWFAAGYFTTSLPVKRFGEAQFSTIQQLFKELGRLPFRSDAPSHPSAAPAVQPQQPIVSEAQKFNPMAYSATPPGNSAYLEEYLMQQQQQQQRQNIQHSMLFNRYLSRKAVHVRPSVVVLSARARENGVGHLESARVLLKFIRNQAEDQTYS